MWNLRQQVLHSVPLFSQFLLSGRHFGLAKLADLGILHDRPVTVTTAAGEGLDQAFGDTIGAV